VLSWFRGFVALWFVFVALLCDSTGARVRCSSSLRVFVAILTTAGLFVLSRFRGSLFVSCFRGSLRPDAALMPDRQPGAEIHEKKDSRTLQNHPREGDNADHQLRHGSPSVQLISSNF